VTEPSTSLRSSAGLRAAPLVLALLLAPVPASAEALVRLTAPAPANTVHALIGYGARLWFATGDPFTNANLGDVWSWDPARGKARYERHLFSQSAGAPAVAGGLLYWPFEDSRFSPARAEFAVTDGRRWAWRAVGGVRAYHLHALDGHGGALYAATSEWAGALSRSADGGATWRTLYHHPTPARRVSRLTTLAALGSRLYAGLVGRYDVGPRVLRLAGATLVAAPGFPPARAVSAMVAFGGRLYAALATGHGREVWRRGDGSAEPVPALAGRRIEALAAGEAALWAVSGDGALLRSADGARWETVQRFPGEMPVAVAVHAGRVYVGTRDEGGLGALWGPPAPAPVGRAIVAPAPLPGRPPAAGPADFAALDAALADPSAYADEAERLKDILRALSIHPEPAVGAALAARLAGPTPAGRFAYMGGALAATPAEIARWYLLWALARNGHGRVPPALIRAPWRAAENPSGKYFEPAPAAMWAAAELGQNDPETLAALVSRLGAAGDPPWLTGDAVGALTAITGKRFAYDLPAWRRWWASR